MRPYLSSYEGRPYTFKVLDIIPTYEEYDILLIQNMENLRVSKLNSTFVESCDGTINTGDIIIRQYSREGIGVFGSYIGGYASSGSTTYTDITAEERCKDKNRVPRIIVGLIIILIIFLFFKLSS